MLAQQQQQMAQAASSLNKTILPSNFLETWLPTFLTRHPALVFPSYYRAFKDSFGKPQDRDIDLEENQLTLNMTPYFTRSLFGWYADLFSDAIGAAELHVLHNCYFFDRGLM